MALRRRDWTDLLLQIIDFYVIATGVEQLIWNDITFSYIVCINVLYIPLIVFLKLTRKAGRSNISILLMQFMEVLHIACVLLEYYTFMCQILLIEMCMFHQQFALLWLCILRIEG